MFKVFQDITNLNQYSYSKITCFEQCPWSYKARYIDRVPSDDNGFATAGSVAHGLIDSLYRGEVDKNCLVEEFENRWAAANVDVKLKLPGYTRNMTEKYHTQLSDYFAHFAAYSGDIVATELRFNAIMGKDDCQFMFEGILDCLSVEYDEDGIPYYVIWDSKSKSAWKDEHELNKYLRQLYCYSTFVKMRFGEYPRKLAFNQFRLGGSQRVTEREFDINEYNNTMSWLVGMVKKIESATDYPKVSDEFFCSNLCSARTACASDLDSVIDQY